jgi:signal transduction histidine kinase
MNEPARLLALTAPVAFATLVSSLAARWLVRRAGLSATMVAIAVVASAVTVVDMVVLNHYMLLDPGNWLEVTLVAAYSLTAAIVAALIVGRTTGSAIGQLVETARSLGRNELDARTGPVDAGPELQILATTLDQAAELLQRAIETERGVESQRRDLMTSISHDLRTPLSQIRSMIEAINDGVVDDPGTVRRYAAEMLTSIRSLVEMVDDLFELSQLGPETLAHQRRLPVAEAVERALEMSRPSARARDLRLHSRVDAPPETLCSPKLVRVLHSLVDNAVRYTTEGGTVGVHAWMADGHLRVQVADTGPGIAPDQLARVFEPFWRGDESRTTKGSGLGLALAQRIVEALGGSIQASSTPDVGSCFEVSLPR